MRRPEAADRRGVLIVIPRDSSGDLPVWHPTEPMSGWTPEAVFEAAHSYAVAVAFSASDVWRMTKTARRGLLAELSPGVKRAEIVDRLSGVDRFRARFSTPRESSVNALPF